MVKVQRLMAAIFFNMSSLVWLLGARAAIGHLLNPDEVSLCLPGSDRIAPPKLVRLRCDMIPFGRRRLVSRSVSRDERYRRACQTRHPYAGEYVRSALSV